MHLNFRLQLRLQLNLGNPPQRLAQNLRLEFQLPRVGNVLVVASSALAEIRTASLNAIRRSFDQLRHRAARESRLLLPDVGFDLFSGQNKRDKDGHAAPSRFGCNARQAFTAVNQFFDG